MKLYSKTKDSPQDFVKSAIDSDLGDHAAVAAAHHTKYTDAEAVTAAKTVKLDDLAAPDDNTDLDSSTTEHGLLKKLDNNASNFMNGQGAWSAPTSGASLTVAETEVFNGESPTNWTDLDLSAVVGSNPAMVLLKTFRSTERTVAFRKNGDTDEYYFPNKSFGVACVDTQANVYSVLLVTTDSNGVVEWITQLASTFTVDVMAYIK